MFGKKKDKEEKKEKKHRGPIFKLFRFIIGLFFICLIASIAFLIYIGVNVVSTENFNGNETVEKIKSENKSLNVIGDDIIYDSLTDLSNTNYYTISLDETEMNYLLHGLSKKLNSKVDNIYMYYNEDNTYSLYMPIEWLFFKTCLVMDTTLVYSSDTDTINMHISNLSLGKFGVSNFVVKTFILPNINEQYINSLFEKIDLRVKTKIESTYIDVSINSDDFINLILNKVDNDGLFNVVYSTLKESNNISYTFTKEEIGLSANLTDTISENNKNSIESNLSTTKSKMNTLISNKVVNNNNSNLIFNYLINGYSYLSDEDKEKIKKVDLSSISIDSSNIETYSGVIKRDDSTIASKFLIDNFYNLEPCVVIGEDEINNELSLGNIVGTSYAKLDSNNANFAYIIIESLYCSITSDEISFNILLDLNGKETVITLNFEKENGVGLLELKLKDSKIGKLNVSSENSSVIMEFIDKKNDKEFVYVNDNNNLVIDLSVYESERFKGVVEFLKVTSIYDLDIERVKISYKKN